jgi:hypothetical protein
MPRFRMAPMPSRSRRACTVPQGPTSSQVASGRKLAFGPILVIRTWRPSRSIRLAKTTVSMPRWKLSRSFWSCSVVPSCYPHALPRGGEMAFRASCVALLLSSLPIAGCGTVANLVKSPPEEGGKSPFGGVRRDLWCIKKAANGEFIFRTHPKSQPDQHPQAAAVLFCAADLPFTLIGDVVTWPYTAAYSFINQPVPTPPVTQAPTPPPQTTAEGRPQTSPLELLPEPRKPP